MNLLNNLTFVKKIIFQISKPILNPILSLKNIHKGESCYIFGDGISIKWFDLKEFTNKPVFSLNKIAFHKQSNFLNLKYSLFIEPFYFYPYFWDRDKATVEETGKKFFKNNIQKKFRDIIGQQNNTTFFVNLSNYPVLRNPKNYLFQLIHDEESNFLRNVIKIAENILWEV